MEEELVQEVYSYIRKAERKLKEERVEAAYDLYMDALHTIAGYLVYRESGMLLSGRELMGIVRVRHGEVYSIIKRYEGVTDVDRDTLRVLDEDVKGLMERVLPPLLRE